MKNIIFRTFKEVNQTLPPEAKKKQTWILVLLFVNSIFELIGLSTLLPLFSIVVSEDLPSNIFYQFFESVYGIETVKGFMLLLGIHIAGIIILKNIASIMIYNQIGKFAFKLSKGISFRALRSKYQLSYLNLFSENSHNHIWEVNSLPNFYTNFLVLPLYTIINELIIVAIIVITMLVYDFKMLMIVGITIVPIFLIFYRSVKNKIQQYEQEKAKLLPKVNSTVQQMILGYTDVQVTGTEKSFLGIFDHITDSMKNIYTKLYVYNATPSKVVESAIIFGVLAVIFYGFVFIEDREGILGLLTLYGVAAFKLAPSSNKIMMALMNLKKYSYTIPRLKSVLSLEDRADFMDQHSSEVTAMAFKNEIRLNDIEFAYKEGDDSVLHGVNLSIHKGKSLGIVGKSGSGKSTMMKVILGFLDPKKGNITIDGVELTELNMASWRKLIGYVSQDVFIIEGSIKENIAFGIEEKDIDVSEVNKALETASLSEFVQTLPEGIETQIGERGSQISGGQKQRIAIARALYSGASVLFFDEATSALDKDTEREITESIKNIGQGEEITTIIIAHNVQTLKYCHEVVEMELGKVKSTTINV